MRSKAVIAVTEAGEKVITPAFLLDVMAQVISHGFAAEDFDGPTSSYLCGSLNVLGKLGFLRVEQEGVPLPEQARKIDTDKPPSFLSDAFRDDKGGNSDITDPR